MADFKTLVTGYRRFHRDGYSVQYKRWQDLSVNGQHPTVMIISCCDSRVEPSQIFDTHPGEIFVVRNVANLVPPFEPDRGRHGVSAALEFGITQLGIKDIVVLGHGQCGGVQAALSRHHGERQNGFFLDNWISLLDHACMAVVHEHGDTPDAVKELEFETVRVSLRHLMTFPFVAERLANGTLNLHGAHFTIRTGILQVMDATGAFRPA